MNVSAIETILKTIDRNEKTIFQKVKTKTTSSSPNGLKLTGNAIDRKNNLSDTFCICTPMIKTIVTEM
ncbi:hypothetical protein PSDVSF_17000 [Pseudodesulfovibrio sediminis]|uniref:Uncharacterized protein n=1 Tax=Pseudodesulfovibrio sediminis TaxID=2810563 RepID=A0ABN6EST0_9BACT|nr:hypothetical protein PSDVSF_17000 [Pseudodesulfovibrio sediminis]